MKHTDNIYDLPQVHYVSVRDVLKNADIMFAVGKHWISKGIQRWTKSPWSHIGLIFWIQNRIIVFESVDHGVRAIPLSTLVRQTPGEIVIGRSTWMDSNKANLTSQAAIDNLGVPYDWALLSGIMWRIFWGKGKKADNAAFICSELVEKCFEDAGYQFQYDKRGFITPENIWCDKSVEVVGRLV